MGHYYRFKRGDRVTIIYGKFAYGKFAGRRVLWIAECSSGPWTSLTTTRPATT